MKIALLTEIPAPYRIPLFNALATTPGIAPVSQMPARGTPIRAPRSPFGSTNVV